MILTKVPFPSRFFAGSKGQTFEPVELIEVFFTTLLLIGMIGSVQVSAQDYINSETLDIQTTRVENAALALTSVPEGHIEISSFDGPYEFRYRNGAIALRYKDKTSEEGLDTLEGGFNSVSGPSSFTSVDGTLCLRSERSGSGSTLSFEMGGC